MTARRTNFPDNERHKPRYALCPEYRDLYGPLHKRYVDDSACYCAQCMKPVSEIDDWLERLYRHVELCRTCPKEPKP